MESHGYERFAVSRAYDQYGRPDAITYPTGFSVRQSYTPTGWLESVKNGSSVGPNYWTAFAVTARGQITGEALGNGVYTSRTFDPETGLVQSITGTYGAGGDVQNEDFVFDIIGDLTRRRDTRQSNFFVETFGYDNLNRLTGVTTTGTAGVTVGYDAIGNVLSRTDVGTFNYGTGAGPHALTSVTNAGAFNKTCTHDPNGNRIADGGTAIDYSSANQPVRMTKGGEVLRFDYSPGRALHRQTLFHAGTDGLTQIVRDYVGGLYEREVTSEGLTRHIHYISGGSGVIAIYTDERSATASAPRLRYLHKDHLGSVDAITNESGTVLERPSFDAWGRRRTVAYTGGAWQVSYPAVPAPSETHRGFTGHEMLDAVGLVHMGGRIYDPITARFLSPDPFVQSPDDMQNLHRYSYVLNNPLSYTDPSGFFFKGLRHFVQKNWKTIAAVAIGVATGYGFAALAGQLGATGTVLAAAGGAGFGFGSAFSGTLLAGGSVGDALRAGLRSGVISGLSAGVTDAVSAKGVFDLHDVKPGDYAKIATKALVHGTIQGGVEELRGGQFIHGFAAGAFAGASSPYIEAYVPSGFSTAAAAAVGGTASVLGGGKFGNGAVSGAFIYLFNQVGESLRDEIMSYPAAPMDGAANAVANIFFEARYFVRLSGLFGDEAQFQAKFEGQIHDQLIIAGAKAAFAGGKVYLGNDNVRAAINSLVLNGVEHIPGDNAVKFGLKYVGSKAFTTAIRLPGAGIGAADGKLRWKIERQLKPPN